MYLSTPNPAFATPFGAHTLSRSSSPSIFDSILSLDKGDSQLQRWSSLIGIITAIVGNILISFALNIQRYAHIKLHEERAQRKERSKIIAKRAQSGYGTLEANGNGNGGNHEEHDHDGAEEDEPLRRSFHSTDSQSTTCSKHDSSQVQTYLKSPYWWGGIILMTIGEAGNFLAYGFAPASIVSPLGVVALISNCVIAPIMLKERFRLRDFWGVVVAVAGAVVVVLSAKQQEKKLGPHEIWGAITTLEFEIYMAVTVGLIIALMYASPKYGNQTILVDLGLVGLFGGYTALSTKGVASMLSSTLWRALTTPVTYALVVVLVGTAIMQVRYVNRALQRFDSTQVIPVQFVMFTLSVIIGSAILYRDFEKATADSVSKFIGGCLLTFFGVFLITSGRPPHDDNEEEDSDDEEEGRIRLADQEHTGGDNIQQRDQEFDLQSQGLAQVGDGTYDEPSESRRSSRVSFVETSSRPRTPKAHIPYPQSARIPPSSEPNRPEQTPLLSNLWRTSAEDLLGARHPGMTTTISSPVLPTEAQTDSLRPAPPNRAISQGNVHTHPSQQHTPAPPQADRPVTPISRHSISRMMPGPFISPLSGGLSVVVADTLRRNAESPRSKSVRRPRLGLRRSKSGSQGLSYTADGSQDELGTSPLKNVNTEEQISKSLGNDGGDWSRMTRTRSLSNTLGDLFRGKRQKTDSWDDDAEAGPSGS
ncbi:magnesium transporter NIPA-domain-containing protein [Tricladium varicosporioides]|nr:magnesium transporter NIPA-domain-containing protein [Hymenoscyphus varicosporioides]